jgi:uncharacterized protein (DUF305 family)
MPHLRAHGLRPHRRAGVFAVPAALLCLIGAGACAGGVGVAPRQASLSTAELEALYHARADSALMRFSEADAAFMTQMIGHHVQALVMASLAPTRATSPQILTLAARITNAQRDEIATMQRWLEDRGRPVPQVASAASFRPMADHTDHAAHGPGMLTAGELEELERAWGADFDRLFLTYMIRHHEGAVTMVHDLFATDGAALDPSVFKVASDIQVDQRTEIARMQRMLSDLSGAIVAPR